MHAVGDRVADLRFVNALDRGGEKADLAHAEILQSGRMRSENPEIRHVVVATRGHEPNALALLEHAIDHADHDDRATVGVVPTVEDECTQRSVRIALGRGDPRDDRFEDLVDPDAGFSAGLDCTRCVDADHFLNLTCNLLRLCAGEVDLVQHRNDREIVLDR